MRGRRMGFLSLQILPYFEHHELIGMTDTLQDLETHAAGVLAAQRGKPASHVCSLILLGWHSLEITYDVGVFRRMRDLHKRERQTHQAQQKNVNALHLLLLPCGSCKATCSGLGRRTGSSDYVDLLSGIAALRGVRRTMVFGFSVCGVV